MLAENLVDSHKPVQQSSMREQPGSQYKEAEENVTEEPFIQCKEADENGTEEPGIQYKEEDENGAEHNSGFDNGK